jgi:hypothetical protein
MLPGFTAERALGRPRAYAAPLRTPTPANAAEIQPQQRAVAEGRDGRDAQMCTCPCCIRYHGQLVCC